MKVYPFPDIVAAVQQILEGTYTEPSFLAMKALVHPGGQVLIYQQFLCAGCGTKQTMDEPNILHTHGKCEECGAVTDIKRCGCNYAVHFVGGRRLLDA